MDEVKKNEEVPNSSSDKISGNANHVNNLTLRDYLETATDATRRTRFITIIMIVASVLVLVSILNSSDSGWITLRLNALHHKASLYTVRKFPLLCKCDPYVEEELNVNEELKGVCKNLEEENKDLFWAINKLEGERKNLDTEMLEGKTKIEEAQRAKNAEDKNSLCDEENVRLKTFVDTMQRLAAETKYTVHVPFFGVAFDVNDIGILGGFGLWIVLILLRLSLRSQIVSLRIGFKEAFARDQEKDFYEILAAQQVFVFPPLRDEKQQVTVSQGWVEQWWRQSTLRKIYYRMIDALFQPLNVIRGRALSYFNLEDNSGNCTSIDLSDSVDKWQANRNMSLRIVPKVLSLLPFIIYLFQFSNDIYTLHYGNELSLFRTLSLVILSSFFLLNTLIFGIWCITKWNELDRLWDYYDKHIIEERKLGEPIHDEKKSVAEK